MQAKGMPPQGEPIAPQPPKAAPKKLPAAIKTGAHDVGFVFFQEPKTAPAAQPPNGAVPLGPGDEAMSPPTIPSPPVTLWMVDAKDKDGETQRRTLPVPGEVTMMKFSPDGN